MTAALTEQEPKRKKEPGPVPNQKRHIPGAVHFHVEMPLAVHDLIREENFWTKESYKDITLRRLRESFQEHPIQKVPRTEARK
jgi:hypothetical protein